VTLRTAQSPHLEWDVPPPPPGPLTRRIRRIFMSDIDYGSPSAPVLFAQKHAFRRTLSVDGALQPTQRATKGTA
jgi:hypothetical protein